MSSGPNHRRGHDRVLERGPRYENGNPAAGCNSTHVARGRKAWKLIYRKKERRRLAFLEGLVSWLDFSLPDPKRAVHRMRRRR